MPIEIKELHIRVNVDNNNTSNGNNTDNAAANTGGEPDPALIQACVDKVLEIIAKKAER